MIGRSKESFDFRLLIILPLLIIVVVVAFLLNNKIGYAPVVSDELDIDNSDLKIEWNKYATYNIELEETLNITRPGTYTLSGVLTTGGINIDVTIGHVKLVLDNVSIKNPDGPAINCSSADALVIESKGKNYLEDGAKYAEYYDLDVTGAIYTKSDLVLTGEGQLKVVSNYQDGIISKDDLTIRSGKYNVISKDDGIRGKDSIHIVNGEIVIDSKADGLKSTNETDHGKGFIYIENGDILISSGDDGMHAAKELIINDGVIDITKSYEGLEAPKITISQGEVKIKSTDDGINAGAGTSTSNTPRPGGISDADKNCIIAINGGNIYINAAGDGVDSNGYVYMNDGRLIVDGPTNDKNGALDAGMGLVINGGEVIAVGSSGMAEGFSKESKQLSTKIIMNEFYKPGSKITLKDKDGETIMEHESVKRFSSIVLSNPNFELGEEYILYIDGKEFRKIEIKN